MAANPIIVIGGSDTLGSAAGRTLALNNFSPALLASVHVQYNSTATAGNRIPTLAVKDPSGNVLWGAQPAAVQAASVNVLYAFGSGIQTAAPVAGGTYAPVSLSDQMVLPPGSQLTLLDSANIDVNDTVAIFNALLAVGA